MQRMRNATGKVRVQLARRKDWDTHGVRLTLIVGGAIAVIVVAIMGYSGFFGYSYVPIAFVLVGYFVLLGPRLRNRKTPAKVIGPPTRSCSSCNTEVDPGWTICKCCGSLLSEATTHVTHTVEEQTRMQRVRTGY